MSERPKVYSCRGVVLRRRNLGEADSIFTIYTEPLGKIDAVARGVRKLRSKMRGHLEPLSLVDLLVARGRSLDVITQAATADAVLGLRDDLDRGASGMYCAELVDRFVAEHATGAGVLDLLLETLAELAAGGPAQLIRRFELELLAVSGYEVQLDGCAICSASLPAEDTLFSSTSGGLICRQCRGRAGEGRIIGVRAIKVLRYARQVPAADFARLNIDEDAAHDMTSVLAAMVHQVLDREPLTQRYVEAISRLEKPGHPALPRGSVR
jgi:DNA repair protein RecO (recombination protein O)